MKEEGQHVQQRPVYDKAGMEHSSRTNKKRILDK